MQTRSQVVYTSFSKKSALQPPPLRLRKGKPAIRAASKPDSVHPARTPGSDHSSEQSTRDFIASSRTRAGRAARSIPYLILLQGGLAMRVRSRVAPVVSYTAFSPLPPRGGGLFSVALSICGDCRRTPGLHGRVLCPAESGLSSPSRARPVTRADRRKVKDRGTGCARTSCRPQGPYCAVPAAPRTAAASCGSRRTRRRG